VRLVVRDTGHGMDAATQARAFEPFFTTKDVGAGTGLGLATVFGIVRQCGGAVRVESAPGRGACFTCLLPVADADDAPAPRPASSSSPSEARGVSVLLVEDETSVRATARRMLERRGYHVLEARHGVDALQVWRAHRSAIDAVVTDLRMPEMGGRELATRLREQAPALPVVFMSGYSDEGADAARAPHEAFIGKPCSSDELVEAVERVLRAGDEVARRA
jgi:CheY-like chemotaxis protein